MEKTEFIEKAPQYYALALAVTLLNNNNKGGKTVVDLDAVIEPGNYNYFQKRDLVEHASKMLAEAGVVELIPDDFGPTILKPREILGEWMAATELSAFQKWREIRTWQWLRAAIRSVNETFDRLKVEAADFEPAVDDSQWEPIPLDRNSEELKNATEALDDAIKAIEGDNGYAAKVPAEREYVLSRLKEFSKTLKEMSEVYWPQIRANALDPLGRVIKRFGPAAVGVAALAARTAITDWIKANWSRFLDWF